MDSSIKAGIVGFFLSFAANALLPVYLYFVPSFIVAILVIYFYRLATFKDGLVAALMTYLFSDLILGTIDLAASFVVNEPYPSFDVDVLLMLSPLGEAVSVVIAAFIGMWLVQKSKVTEETLLSPIPP